MNKERLGLGDTPTKLFLNTQRRDADLGNRDYISYALWTIRVLFEVVADIQKSTFRSNDVRKNEKLYNGRHNGCC